MSDTIDTPSTPAAPVAQRSSWRSPAAVASLVIVGVLALVADLATKSLAFRTVAGAPVQVDRRSVLDAGPNLGQLIPPHEPVVVVPHVLEFTLVLNPGAVFGTGGGKRWFFVAFTVLAAGFGVWMFGRWTRPKDHLAHVAIALLLAGGLGNLYDRLVYACVRDFIHPLPGVHWPFGWSLPGAGREVWPWVSNVADLWLIIGIGLLLVHTWRRPVHHRAAPLKPETAR